MPLRKEGNCIERTLTASASGIVVGSVVGLVQRVWIGPQPEIKVAAAKALEAGKVRPQAYATSLATLMGNGAAYFALAGAAFAAGDCIAESLRGNKRDMWNGVIGGACAGAALGFATKSAPKMVACSAGMALAVGICEACDYQIFQNWEGKQVAKKTGLAKPSS